MKPPVVILFVAVLYNTVDFTHFVLWYMVGYSIYKSRILLSEE